MQLRQINPAGLELLKRFEGFREKAYLDVVGIPTIGYGFTKGVKLGDTITKQEAEKRLALELADYERCVNDNVNTVLNPNEFSALVCFVYNIGCGAFIRSTLLKLLNQGKKEQAAKQLLRWNKGGGKTIPGLTNRRNAELKLFNGNG